MVSLVKEKKTDVDDNSDDYDGFDGKERRRRRRRRSQRTNEQTSGTINSDKVHCAVHSVVLFGVLLQLAPATANDDAYG